MPAQASNQTSIRAPGHRSHLYFAYFAPSVVWEATVGLVPSGGYAFLAVTTVSGTSDDVERGYLVRIETSGGVLKGITNVSAGGSITANNLPIHEYSAADIDIDIGDVVKVYNIPYLADKLPTANFTFSPDDIPYSTQGTAFAPNCRSGGHFIGLVDGFGTASPSSYATVPTAGSLSENLDPDSSAPGTHLWELLTGTLAFAPGSVDSDANPVIEASVGYGVAKHTYTDSSNSAAWSQFVCFQVYDATTMPGRLIEASLNADETTGWAAEVELFTNASIDALPDGSLVGLFAHEWMGGSVQSFGSAISGRSHIKLIGFLHRDENEITPQNKRVRLSIQSPMQRLSNLPGFSKIFTRTATDWTQIEDLSVLLGIVHLLHYYSFFTEMFDVIIDAAFLDKLYSAFYINEQVALEQARELADGVDARITNLRTGELCLHTHPCLIPEGDRSGVTTTYTIGRRDLQRMNFVRDHWKVVKLLETRGFIAGASDNTPVFSRYPGNTPGRGAQTIAVERIIADDQSDSNTRCGRRGGKADGTYINSDGEYMRAAEWSPVLFGSHDFFDFNKEYVATDLGVTSNLRGIDLSAMRYYLTRITVRYHDGTADVEPVFATATNAPPGSTYIPEDLSLPDYTEPDYTPQPLPQPGSTIRMPSYSNDTLPANIVALAAASAQFGYAAWNGGSPVWVENSTGLGAGYGLWLVADPYDYRRYFALMSDGLYRNDNPKGGGSWSLVANNAAIFGDAARIGKYMEMSINRKGYIAICTGTNTFVYSTDYGATWNVVSINGAANNYGTAVTDVAQCKFSITGFNNGATGRIYALVFYANFFKWKCWRSEDWGATWTVVSTDYDFFGDKAIGVISPYRRAGGSPDNINDGSQEVMGQSGTGHSANKGRVLGSVNAGVTWSQLYAVGVPTMVPAGAYIGRSIHTFTYDSDYIAGATLAAGAGGVAGGAYTSKDGGTTIFSDEILFAAANLYVCLNGSPVHREFLVAWARNSGNTADKKICWTSDFGATWSNFAPPTFFSGNEFCANVQIDISDLIAPA